MIIRVVLLASMTGIISCIRPIFGRTQMAVPTTGPCVLNNDEFKCTEHGYYEMVQCDCNGCFCVNAHNRLIAYDTKTTSNKVIPKCSACYNQIKNLYAYGQPPKNTFIPKCDVSMGDYEPLQCDATQGYCFCVDVKTGIEVKGTRRKKESNQFINCGNIEFSIDPATFPTTNKDESLSQEKFPVGRESCKLDRDKGYSCSTGTSSIRYYFDLNTAGCLAFKYLGCGGNENNYRTSNECFSTCKLPDLSGCSGMYPSARGANGEFLTCGNFMMMPAGFITTTPRYGPQLNEDGCPKDYKCVMGAFFGLCCSKANEDRYYKAYHPTCTNGREAYYENKDGWKDVRLGKNCTDNFCPSGYQCYPGEIFAYCC